jgi:hypothetical protein
MRADKLLIVKEFLSALQQHDYCKRWWTAEAVVEILKYRLAHFDTFNDTTPNNLCKFISAITKYQGFDMIDSQERNDQGVYRTKFRIKNANQNSRYYYYVCSDKSKAPIRLTSETAHHAYTNNRINTTTPRSNKRQKPDDESTAVSDEAVHKIDNTSPQIPVPLVDYWSSMNGS